MVRRTPTHLKAPATWVTSSTSEPRPAKFMSLRMAAVAARATTGSIFPPASTALPSLSITTDPIRGSHSAYAVTTSGIFYIADSIPSATNPTPTWVNITGNIFTLPYTIFGQTYNPTTDPNSTKLTQSVTLTSIIADWRYAIPNNPSDPSKGYHPVLYVGAQSGVYMSIDQGKTWTLFPDTTFGAVAEGGYLPHVSVTDLDLSLGNIDPNTGLPNTAGPYDPTNTTSTPDPDILLASTYGQGAFAINVAPMTLPNQTAIDPASVSGTAADGTPLVTTATPSFDGLSEITAFGNATRITIVDETPDDSTFGQVIGGFDPSNVAGTNVAANWTDSLGNFAIPVNAGVFTSNGLKTIELYATDDAGSVGNKITISFTLDVAGISPPTVPITPTLELAPYDVTGQPGYTSIATPNLIGATSSNATVELFQVINGVPTPFSPVVTTTADANGNFTLTFPDMTGGVNGTYPFTVVAQASNTIGASGFSTPPTTFTIIIGTPPAPANFRLAPTSDTGIMGDDVTNDRMPNFIGTTESNATVELFQVGSSIIYNTVTADANGDFSIHLPSNLLNGSISLYVKAVDHAGNLSTASNTLAVTIVSVASDYNADSYSDATLYRRGTTTFTGTLTSGSALVTGISSLTGLIAGVTITGTGIPAGSTIKTVNTTPFIGTLTSGSALVTGIASTTALFAGESVTGTGVPAGTTIKTVNSLTTITLSANVTAGGSQKLTATTITLSANATASGSKALTAEVGLWFVKSNINLTIAFTGTLTTGSALVTGITSTAGLFAGESVTGTGVPAGTTITSVNDSTSITLSATVTSNGSQNLTATPVPFWFASGTAFGPSNVTPFQGDFDGDGYADLAYYQSSTATWYMDDSQSNIVTSFKLGTPNASVPVVGYFNANGPEEVAVFTQGVWTIANGSTVTFGQAGDIPEPGDYTGIGYDELAVYRPSNGQFLVLVPGPNNTTTTMTISIPGIGVGTPDLASLVPVPGAYDNQYYFDHNEAERTEAAVFDPKTGVFTILGPNGVDTPMPTFNPGDIPAPADYLGNGSTQPAVFRPSNGNFYELIGGTQTIIASFGAGASADIPLAAPLSYRTPADPPADPPSSGVGTDTGTGTGAGTGSGTTGNGDGTTGSGTTTPGTGTGSSSPGQGSSATSTPPAGTSTPPLSPPGTSTHKKKLAKKKVAAHRKKVTVHAKPKKAHHPAAKPKVHVVSHPAKQKVIKVSTSHSALSKKPTHVVDMALEGVHVNLRRSKKG